MIHFHDKVWDKPVGEFFEAFQFGNGPKMDEAEETENDFSFNFHLYR